ncbi:hypothetical protein QTN25_008665 [Entamoeba marina]
MSIPTLKQIGDDNLNCYLKSDCLLHFVHIIPVTNKATKEVRPCEVSIKSVHLDKYEIHKEYHRILNYEWNKNQIYRPDYHERDIEEMKYSMYILLCNSLIKYQWITAENLLLELAQKSRRSPDNILESFENLWENIRVGIRCSYHAQMNNNYRCSKENTGNVLYLTQYLIYNFRLGVNIRGFEMKDISKLKIELDHHPQFLFYLQSCISNDNNDDPYEILLAHVVYNDNQFKLFPYKDNYNFKEAVDNFPGVFSEFYEKHAVYGHINSTLCDSEKKIGSEETFVIHMAKNRSIRHTSNEKTICDLIVSIIHQKINKFCDMETAQKIYDYSHKEGYIRCKNQMERIINTLNYICDEAKSLLEVYESTKIEQTDPSTPQLHLPYRPRDYQGTSRFEEMKKFQ